MGYYGTDMQERRSESRLMCSHLVQVAWTEAGVEHGGVGNLEDVSPSGCRLQMDSAVPHSAAVKVRCGGQLYSGTVRYCQWAAIGFDVGVEFTQPGAWDRQQFEPDYLLDVPPPKPKQS